MWKAVLLAHAVSGHVQMLSPWPINPSNYIFDQGSCVPGDCNSFCGDAGD
jgi:hypothetical protein